MFEIFYINGLPDNVPASARPAQSIEQARHLCRTRFFWIVDYLSDYTGFDFLWEPPPWQNHQRHVWPSQWQRDGGTSLWPKHAETDTNYHSDVVPRCRSVPKLTLIHGEPQKDHDDTHTRFVHSYHRSLLRALKKCPHEHVWVTTDLCDYRDFDFTWHPDPFQRDMLHVFASDDNIYGDTFYVDVAAAIKNLTQHPDLTWCAVNFVPDLSVPRRPLPLNVYHGDSVVPILANHRFTQPIELFSRRDSIPSIPAITMWQADTQPITPLDHSSSTVIVPRRAQSFIRRDVYDYPVIDFGRRCVADEPLDIVFISNGESNADENWGALLDRKQGNPNRTVRVDGVNGRVAAYHAAARASTTAWFFAVFAKLKVEPEFDWTWQPDYLQREKHYIFYARNPVTGLVYGHQAMIAYNREMVLANHGSGLDFTLDQPHEVVPIVSGTAHYDHSAWMAWRTAFREAIKLRHSLPDVENEYRLNQWLTQGHGRYGHWSQHGAQDGIDYYDSVKGDFDQLYKSYEWSWLASFALMRRNLTPDQ